MCGRYRLSRRKQIVEEYFEAVSDEPDWAPRYNIAPTQPVPVIRQHPKEPVRQLSLFRWGLISSWAKDMSGAAMMINARSETASTKPAFRDALNSRRCLIPADGFYEWVRVGKTKQPYCFEVNDGKLFAFAGIWDRWKDLSGNWIKTVSILTTTPNAVTSAVHDRMPVILDPDCYDLWLDPGMHDVRVVSDMLKPYDARLMRCYPVSNRVNHVANDDEKMLNTCLAPLSITAPDGSFSAEGRVCIQPLPLLDTWIYSAAVESRYAERDADVSTTPPRTFSPMPRPQPLAASMTPRSPANFSPSHSCTESTAPSCRPMG
jgi:putative SOS response-associated peptidase YedK